MGVWTFVGRAVLIVGLAWLVLVVLAAVFQRQLLYLPDRSEPATPPDVAEVALRTDDGLALTAWLVPAATDDPLTTILLAPGNAGNRAARLPTARALADRGHQVLLLDYRGYGGNPGRPTEAGMRADALAARRALEAHDDVDPDRIVYLGESIGTAVVAWLAVEEPPAALVLRSPFPSLVDVGRRVYPFLPIGTLLRDRHDTVTPLARHDGDVLVVAGTADRIIATELSIALAESVDAELVLVDGADHNDAALFVGGRFLDAVDDHVRRAVRTAR